jgi:hypothetical protein
VNIFILHVANNSRVLLKLLIRSYSIFIPQDARMVRPRPLTAGDHKRDHVLKQRIAPFKRVEPEHSDIPDGRGRESSLTFARYKVRVCLSYGMFTAFTTYS